MAQASELDFSRSDPPIDMFEQVVRAQGWRFERIEFPLAVAALLLATLLGVVNILQYRETQYLENGVMFWLQNSNIWMVGDARKNLQGNLSPTPEPLGKYVKYFAEPGGRDPQRTPLESLEYIRSETYK